MVFFNKIALLFTTVSHACGSNATLIENTNIESAQNFICFDGFKYLTNGLARPRTIRVRRSIRKLLANF